MAKKPLKQPAPNPLYKSHKLAGNAQNAKKNGVFALRKVAIASLALMVLLLFVVWNGLFRPLPLPKGGLLLEVKSGDSYSAIIKRLSAQSHLRMPWLVRLYQHFTIKKPILAGVYFIPQGSNARYALLKLKSGQPEQTTVRILEGWNVKQIRNYLASIPTIRESITNMTGEQVAEKLNLPTKNPEGWFNPDTYFFPLNTNDLAVLRRLTQVQQKTLNDEWAGRATDIQLKTPYEALILASIIEKETNVDKELADVSAVFHNRLKINMRLQTDPTVIYGMGSSYNGNIRKVDLQTKTAYNTYLIDGLPPTPISNPSKASIHAALHPSNSKALYFVATGMGGHTFSLNYEDHKAAVKKYIEYLNTPKVEEGERLAEATPVTTEAKTTTALPPATLTITETRVSVTQPAKSEVTDTVTKSE